MGGVDLNDVATFVRVAEGGGFTAAARALGVPKSTVSRALARLEKALGVRLLHRTTRALGLTDAGRAYFERVREALSGVEDASSEVVDLGKDPRGTIRITAPVDIGQALLAEVITRFIEKYPDVGFEVSLTARVVDLVAEGFDLAIRASPLGDSSLVARKMGSAEMGLFASPAYLKKRGTPADVGDLEGHELIGFKPRIVRGPLVLTSSSGSKQVATKGSIVVDDLLFVLRLVSAGAGIGILPLFLLRCGTRDREDFVRVLPDWTAQGGSLSVVAPSARHEPRRVKLFREFLLSEAKRLGFGAA